MVLMSCISVIVSYLFHCLTTEEDKSVNKDRFIRNSALVVYGHRESKGKEDKQLKSADYVE